MYFSLLLSSLEADSFATPAMDASTYVFTVCFPLHIKATSSSQRRIHFGDDSQTVKLLEATDGASQTLQGRLQKYYCFFFPPRGGGGAGGTYIIEVWQVPLPQSTRKKKVLPSSLTARSQ
jgi:hypothetical protein